MTAFDEAKAPAIATMTTRRFNKGLLTAALRLAADASAKNGYASHPQHERTLVKRSLVDELRRELDQLGLGPDWRSRLAGPPQDRPRRREDQLMAQAPQIDVDVNPRLSITEEQVANLLSWIQEPRGPRHTVGVDIRARSDLVISGPYLSVWCSCGWSGDRISLEPSEIDPDIISDDVIEEAARSWRLHVRLSNRVYASDKKLRKQAWRERQAAEEEE